MGVVSGREIVSGMCCGEGAREERIEMGNEEGSAGGAGWDEGGGEGRYVAKRLRLRRGGWLEPCFENLLRATAIFTS